jgi:Protein of unknown function (DUF3043)
MTRQGRQSATLAGVPLPFRRDSSNVASSAAEAAKTEPTTPQGQGQRKGHTPSKRELGKVTKRRQVVRRTPEPPPTTRREAYRRLREKDRAQRAKGLSTAPGDRMLKRDQGPIPALVRDIVDSRITVGTWFFAGAFIVLIGSSAAMPPLVRVASNLLWVTLFAATIVDSVMISRKIKKLVRQRFPQSDRRLGSLYFYGIMRGITFRRLRMPKPRIKLGEEF